MPTLNWRGKDAVLNHHLAVPYHLLRCEPSMSAGEPGSGNLIVEGDNLTALKALLPYYKGQVKCIYIDPPYNTGVDDRDNNGQRSGWIYSDSVNSPEIRAWLNKVVGGEGEDLSRHDKWLCMMLPRLTLLKDFLSAQGVLFVSIAEHEYGNLRAVLDEVFGVENRIGTLVWKNATDNNPTNIAVEHEYILCYAKNKSALSPEWKAATLGVKTRLLAIQAEILLAHSDEPARQAAWTRWLRVNKAYIWPFEDYKFFDHGGIYTGLRGVHNPGKEGYRYDVLHPVTGRPCKEPLMGYRFPPATMAELLSQGRIIFGDDETKIIELKVYLADYRAKLSSVIELDGRVGTNEIKDIFPESVRPFDFPKPTALLKELLAFVTEGDDIVLDSFAGSGTTAHAVLALNAEDGHKRRFIAVEMKPAIATGITSERVRRVAGGYTNAKGESVPGLGGGFRYCRLGAPLFAAHGGLGTTVTREALAHHIYFTETGEPLPHPVPPTGTLIGACAGRSFHLFFDAENGVLVTEDVLATLPSDHGHRVVFADACLVPEESLREQNVTFKQIPYAIKG